MDWTFIACDRDVVVLGNYVTQGLKLVEVFVEHEKTNPDIYTPPKAKRLVIEELDAEPIISKAGITPVARKLVLDVNNNQTCGKEKGKSSGKDLEGQKTEVDEENNVDDVDVDMKDFDFHVDEGVEFMGCRDIEQTVDIEEGDGEEIEVLDNDYFESASDSDDEGSRLRKRKLKEIRKQAHANEQIYKTYFYVGKDFPNKEDVMAYIKEHSIKTRREIRFEKNDGERVRAVCRGVIPCLPCVDEITSGANQVIGPSQGSGPSQVSGPSEGIGSKVKWTKKKIAVTRSPQKLTINGGKPNSKKQLDGNQCPWVLLVSKIKNSETWQVRTYKSEHKCLQTRKNIYATYQWFSKELVQQLKTNPYIPVRAVQEQLTQKHELNVTQSKAFRAKQEAEKKLRGDYTQ
ncbi:mutator type transposase [Tanacetum coccineum]